MFNAPDSFNPLFNPGIAGQFTIRFMYDTLLGMPEINKFTPQLANSIDTTDNQNFTIKLNEKAKWTDGKPVTADDVVFTFNLIANPKVETTKGSYINMLEGTDSVGKRPDGTPIPDLVAVDEHTVTFRTKKPVDPNYLKSMLGFEVYIVPKHVFEKSIRQTSPIPMPLPNRLLPAVHTSSFPIRRMIMSNWQQTKITTRVLLS